MTTGLRRICILAVLVASTQLGACGEREVKTGGPHYYATFKTKSLPQTPIKPLTAEEAKDGRAVYYVAYFNERGDTVKLTKFRNGIVDWESTYEYKSDGKGQAGRTVAYGPAEVTVIEYQFGKDGRIDGQTISKRPRGSGDPAARP